MCSHVVTQMVDLLPCDVVIDEKSVLPEHFTEVVVIDQSISQAGTDPTLQTKSNVSSRWETFNSLITHKTLKRNVGA